MFENFLADQLTFAIMIGCDQTRLALRNASRMALSLAALLPLPSCRPRAVQPHRSQEDRRPAASIREPHLPVQANRSSVLRQEECSPNCATSGGADVPSTGWNFSVMTI